MFVVLIQLILSILGGIIVWLLRLNFSYAIAYIYGSFCIILPTLIIALLWFYTKPFINYHKSMLILFSASILKILMSLTLLFICFNMLSGKYFSYLIIGFIVSCQGYWLAGLISRKEVKHVG
jgi:F0F1-type ATP synthase assembly protein I